MLLNSENKDFQMAQECDNGVCVYPTEHFIQLKKGISPVEFEEKLNATIGEFNTTTDSLALQSLADIYLSPVKMGWADRNNFV